MTHICILWDIGASDLPDADVLHLWHVSLENVVLSTSPTHDGQFQSRDSSGPDDLTLNR